MFAERATAASRTSVKRGYLLCGASSLQTQHARTAERGRAKCRLQISYPEEFTCQYYYNRRSIAVVATALAPM